MKILLLDPDLRLTHEIKESLMSEPHEVIIAESSDDGIYKLNTGNFDLLITEYKLWGTENIFHILEDVVAKGFDWIVITKEPDVKIAVDALKAGAFDYLQKPLVLLNLQESIKRVEVQRKADF